ncbi:SDR family oxidoreductase [Leptospira perolatii]|uniref:SDR family oxidoreductase n=1 Tax=Leptospira perolatii TaxID=2023191 RepID=A0A2M9ZLA0_9LEPT|nr:SDR family oxidoreductase [Leptospira perolatii]PJZ70307.1 SDR family oxidoreductase [Leptospira perolatii]PJZ72809.1 SDR family oxidoreductase [Leptospira perolatii]
MKIEFGGKVCLVTGGTRGIGLKIAQDLLNSGATVFVTGTSGQKPNFSNLGISASLHNCLTYLPLDLSSELSTNEFLETISDMTIDILVNNAGINRINKVEDVIFKDWQDMLKVNLEGPFRLLQLVLPGMRRRNFGRVVNISSIFGKISREKRSAYTITKYGIHGLTVTSSIEFAKYNVLINTVSPGFILTDLTKKNLSKEEIEELASRIPAGRLGEVGDISSAVLYLCSEANTYISGQNLIVDGGFVNV